MTPDSHLWATIFLPHSNLAWQMTRQQFSSYSQISPYTSRVKSGINMDNFNLCMCITMCIACLTAINTNPTCENDELIKWILTYISASCQYNQPFECLSLPTLHRPVSVAACWFPCSFQIWQRHSDDTIKFERKWKMKICTPCRISSHYVLKLYPISLYQSTAQNNDRSTSM